MRAADPDDTTMDMNASPNPPPNMGKTTQNRRSSRFAVPYGFTSSNDGGFVHMDNINRS